MSLSADIQKYEKIADGGGYIVYFVKVTHNGRQWAVRKRYRDFLKLDEFLRRDGTVVGYQLPPKSFWKRYNKRKLEQRRKGLQHYLSALLIASSSDASLVREFFEVDHFELQEAIRKVSISISSPISAATAISLRTAGGSHVCGSKSSRSSGAGAPLFSRKQQIVDCFMRGVIHMPAVLETRATRIDGSPFIPLRLKAKSLSFTPSQRRRANGGGYCASSAHSPPRQQRSASTASTSSSTRSLSTAAAAAASQSPQLSRKQIAAASAVDSNLGLERRLTANDSAYYSGLSSSYSPLSPALLDSQRTANSLDVRTLKEVLKKDAFADGVHALWAHYEEEIEAALAAHGSHHSSSDSSSSSGSSSDRSNQNRSAPAAGVVGVLAGAPIAAGDWEARCPQLAALERELDAADSSSSQGQSLLSVQLLQDRFKLVVHLSTAESTPSSSSSSSQSHSSLIEGDTAAMIGGKHSSGDSQLSTATSATTTTATSATGSCTSDLCAVTAR